jgi:WD40 repeat protein
MRSTMLCIRDRVLYNPSMPRAFPFLFFVFCFTSCAPPPSPLFFYLQRGDSTSLVLQPSPDSATPLSRIPLAAPLGCSFWSLTPAPLGPWVAVEWDCPYGPTVQVLNIGTQKIDSLLADATIDNRFLAWAVDGKAVYLKAGTLSNPQVLRVELESRLATVLPLPPNTYNLTVSPDNRTILYALSNGIGLGSELWVGDHRILSDAKNILGLMRYAPDGKQFAYIRLLDDQSNFPAGELWVMDSAGKNARLTASADAGRGMPPVWSPDGNKIAFIGRTNPNEPDSINLSIYDLRSSTLITSPLLLVTAPAWSPDSNYLYITQTINDKMELWFYDVRTSKTQKLFADACCAGWIY